MFFFSSAEQRARSADFDRWQQDTDRVLRHPDVKNALGKLGSQLVHLNDNVFLPNIKHGEVLLPRTKAHTNHIPVLVYSNVEDTLQLGTNMLHPTPRRAYGIVKALKNEGVSRPKRTFNQGLDNYLSSLNNPNLNKTRKITSVKGKNANPFTHSIFAGIAGFWYGSRPFIGINTGSNFYNSHVDFRGAAGAHELVHALDWEGLSMPGPYNEYFSELRAYSATGIIMNLVIDPNDSALVQQGYSLVPWASDTLRTLTQHGITLDSVINAPPNIDPVAYLDKPKFTAIQQALPLKMPHPGP